MKYFDQLEDLEQERPPIAGEADTEYTAKLEAERIRAEWRCPLTATAPQRDHRELPLFGGINEQRGLFE